jgi:hypothetical protein
MAKNFAGDLLWHERNRAIDKHGFENTALNPKVSNEVKLVILAEEFGEVARAMTYDNGSVEDLKKELVQVASVAMLWRESLEPASEGEPT